MGSCWDVPPTLGQSSPAPARSPAPPPPPLPRPLVPFPPFQEGPPSWFLAVFGLVWFGLGVGLWWGFWAVVPPPRFSSPPLTCAQLLLQIGPVSLCTCLLSLVFQLAVHLHASFYL